MSKQRRNRKVAQSVSIPVAGGFEALEPRKLLSAVLDLRVAGGGKTANVNAVGQVVQLEAWVVVTGKNGSGGDDGLKSLQSSFLSTNVSGGAANGNLSATPVAPFTAAGSVGGVHADLDGDGDLDIGSNNSLVGGSYFSARSDVLAKDGVISGASNAFKVGTLTFTVSSLNSGSQTNINFRPHASVFPTVLWVEDGTALSDNNGTLLVGAPVVIKRGTPTQTGATVSGRVVIDTNKNNAADAAEPGIANVKVFLDANTNGTLDAGEKNVLTDGGGNYSFSGLSAGPYRVRQVAPSGFKFVNPSTGFFDVTLAANQVLSGKDFADQSTVTTIVGSISGRVVNDLNRNNVVDASEPGLANVKLFLDKNKNGKLDTGEATATTNSTGAYSFGNLAAGPYRVQQLAPSGFKFGSPSTGFFDVTLTTGQNLTGKNFSDLATGPGSITGKVFNDNNANGVFDAGDTVRSNVRVWLDTNKDGIFQTTEPNKLSDASGNFSFTGVTPGSYRVRQASVSGNRFTTNGGLAYYDLIVSGNSNTRNFGNTTKGVISGKVWFDKSNFGVKDAAETGLANWRVFIDKNKNGILDAGEASVLTNASGDYTFNNLASSATPYRIRVVQQTGFTRTAPSSVFYDVTINSGTAATGKNFGEKKS